MYNPKNAFIYSIQNFLMPQRNNKKMSLIQKK